MKQFRFCMFTRVLIKWYRVYIITVRIVSKFNYCYIFYFSLAIYSVPILEIVYLGELCPTTLANLVPETRSTVLLR